jgi:hypothetical protein
MYAVGGWTDDKYEMEKNCISSRKGADIVFPLSAWFMIYCGYYCDYHLMDGCAIGFKKRGTLNIFERW